MNTNKKLALNKQLVVNLDSQNMAEIMGGKYPTWGPICTYVLSKIADWMLSDAIKQQCMTDAEGCSVTCTQYNCSVTCFSDAKCH